MTELNNQEKEKKRELKNIEEKIEELTKPN